MKILMVATRVPYPLTAGFRIRIYNEAKYCRQAGHHVDLLCFGTECEIDRNALEQVFDHIFVIRQNRALAVLNVLMKFLFTKQPLQVALYWDPGFEKKLSALADRYDAVIGNNIRTAEYLKKIDINKVVFDYHDAISYNYLNLCKNLHGIKKQIFLMEQKRVLHYECEVSGVFDRKVIISGDDRRYLEKYGADMTGTAVIPVAVRDDIQAIKADYENDREEICFLGKMSYQPNEDAVIWFSREVFPALKQRFPELLFKIIGIEPTAAVRELQKQEGIVVTGFLENPYEVIAECKAMVVPIRNGAGMQNKVLESMVVGTPAVISPIAAEGMGGEDGVHYFIAGTAEEYITMISELLLSAGMRKQIGMNGQKFVNEYYTWSRLWKMWEKILNRKENRVSSGQLD